MSPIQANGVVWHGEGTAASPLRYEVNEALCEAVRQGNWSTGMLLTLADWVSVRLETEKAER